MVGAITPHCTLHCGEPAFCNENTIMDNTSFSNTFVENHVKPPIRVGSRIRCDDSVGTVRYIGEVSGHSGQWFGIDWDNKERGKHNGSVGGVQYFSASGPKSGSFIRENKIAGSVSCARAIWKCYGEKEDENSAALCKAVIEDWKREIKVPFIEMVGFDSIRQKQSDLPRLLEACVSDMNVSHAGELSTLCPSLKLLDLSKNLLPDWETIATIGRQLPHLERLDLRNNLLELPATDEEALEYSLAFSNLHKVIMTHCSLTWKDVKLISLMLPGLRELVLAFNNITHIDTLLPTNLLHVTQLILDSNPLSEWSCIMYLARIDTLKVLCLNECRLKEIRIGDSCGDDTSDCFKNLEVLHLKWNLIADWRSVSELNKLRRLKKLFLWKNPVTDAEEYDTCSQLIVARIGQLKELNGSEISREARRGAEYDYLKRHGKQWKTFMETKCGGDNVEDSAQVRDFLLTHSRFQLLIDKYGLPDDSLLEKKKESQLIRTKLIEVIIKDEVTGATIKKKLPSTMTIQKVIALTRRSLLSKSRGAESSGSEPSLYCVCTSKSDASQMTVQLENHLKELEYYSVGNGDTIIIKW